MNRMIEWMKKYWFLVSAVLLACLYAMYNRRGRTIDQLIYDAKKMLLWRELERIKEQTQGSGKDHDKALEAYVALKRRHAELLSRLGITAKLDARRNPSPD
jgi:hypothetical protein